MMEFDTFRKLSNTFDGLPRAPRVLLYIPPYGRAIQAPSADAAAEAAVLWAGEHPGRVIGVYELVGYAFEPIKTPEFTPAQSEKAAAELLPPRPENDPTDAAEVPPDGWSDLARRDLTPDQQETMRRLRETMRGEE